MYNPPKAADLAARRFRNKSTPSKSRRNAAGRGGAAGGAREARWLDSWAVSFAVGAVSGMLTGGLNEGGPPVVILLALKGWPNDDVKAMLQFFFSFVCLYQLSTLYSRDIFQTRHLYYDFVGLPAGVFGISVGVKMYSRFDQKTFSLVIVFALLVTGVAYIATAVAGLLEDEVVMDKAEADALSIAEAAAKTAKDAIMDTVNRTKGTMAGVASAVASATNVTAEDESGRELG